MLVNRIKLILITFITMIILKILLKNTIIAGVITVLVITGGYIIIAYIRNKRRINLMEEYCDPEAFIKATEKQLIINGKNPGLNAYLNTDKAAGYIIAGDYNKAKDILLSIDKSKLSVINGSLLAYTINLIGCYYELGEIEKAEKLFETEIPLLCPVNSKMRLAMELLIAERFFFLDRYEESKQKFEQLLNNKKLNKYQKLNILYFLAKIDEKKGDIISAQEKYKEVADKGNKLWISEQARKRLN